MTPQQIEELIKALDKSDSGNDILYVLLSVFLFVVVPVLLWAMKIITKNTVNKVVTKAVEDSTKAVTKSVNPKISLMQDLLTQRERETEKRFLLHIEEIRYLTKMSRRTESKLDDIEEKISKI